MMTYKARERTAFWVGMAIATAITFFSIWMASRIGYREAVRFTRYEEIRKSRNLLRSMERELATNEEGLRRGVEDWDREEFRRVRVMTRSLERARESDEYFRLNQETLGTIAEAYGPSLDQTLDRIDKDRTEDNVRLFARNLWFHLEKMERARDLLNRDLIRLGEELKSGGVEDLFQTIPCPPDLIPELTKEEAAVCERSASPGWVAGPSSPYAGPVGANQDLSFSRHLAVSVLPRGPIVLAFRGSVRKPVRLWLCFCDRAPFDGTLFAGRDDEAIRRLLSGDAGEGSFVVSHPMDQAQGHVIDPHRPIGWRWVFAVLEDQSGERRPVADLVTWKVGKDEPARFRLKPSDKALVLPKGYLRAGTR